MTTPSAFLLCTGLAAVLAGAGSGNFSLRVLSPPWGNLPCGPSLPPPGVGAVGGVSAGVVTGGAVGGVLSEPGVGAVPGVCAVVSVLLPVSAAVPLPSVLPVVLPVSLMPAVAVSSFAVSLERASCSPLPAGLDSSGLIGEGTMKLPGGVGWAL